MNIGVVFAGGFGGRFSMIGRPKQFVEVNGKPIIVYTLEHFEKCRDVDKVVVVCLLNWIDYMWKLVEDYRLKKVEVVVHGGKTSQESIYEGLLAAKRLGGIENTIVLIHDGVRPFIDPKLLSQNIQSVREYGSAITCTKMSETIVEIEETDVVNALDRSRVWIARAPQSFWLKDILEAHEDARRKGKNDYIDSCSLMLQYRPALHFIECSKRNIKITDFEDIYLLQALLRARDDMANYSWGVISD